MEQPAWGIKIAKYFIIPQRVILAVMGVLGIMASFSMRICLSVAILKLVVKREVEDNDDHEYACPADPVSEQNEKFVGEYNWSESQQGLILSSFYWGYILTHVPGGILADKFSGKWMFASVVLITSVCTLLTPLAIKEGGHIALIIIRVIMGCGQGPVYPALSVLLSKWVPQKERGTLGAFVLGGGQLGTIAGNSVSGLLLNAFVYDWTFYFFGAMGLLWSLTFILLCYDDPGSHPFVKPTEKEYLMQEMGSVQRNINLPPIPWRAIMTNIPVIVMIIAQIGHDWGFFVMVTDLPKYMGDVMQFSITKNGLYSSLPYFVMWIISVGSGFLSDWLIKKNKIGLTNARKLFTAIGAFGPGIFMVLASYAGCDRLSVVALFTAAMGSMGTYYAGMRLNTLDMSPNYSGTLMALTNGIGAVAGVLAPYLVGVMTPNATLLEWRMVFWLAFIILFATTVLYVIWGSSAIQDFNDPEKESEP